MFEPQYRDVITNLATPAYVFDIDVLQERIKFIQDMLGDNIQLCYAMKANPFVIQSIEGIINRYEVCSHGEFAICERANIPMEKVVLSGVYKNADELLRVIATYRDRLVYTSESVHQFEMIHEIAKQLDCQVSTLLRITTGNQFGMSEEELCHLIASRKQYPYVDIVGIQHFSGTQRKKLNLYEQELKYVDTLLQRLEKEYGYVAKELEFGSGFYVEYFHGSKAYDEVELLKGFKELLGSLHFQGQIILELGRFIAANCGRYYTEIVDYKINQVPYCIVDGGMHQMTYYGQMMAMKIPYYRQLKKEQGNGQIVHCHVSGSLCTMNDNLVKSLPLENPQIGDILEFQRVGAYAMCEGISLFLSRDLPSIYLYSKQDGLCLQRSRFETNIFNYKGE